MQVRNGTVTVNSPIDRRAVTPPVVALRPWARTGSVDVETLVNWAFVDQRADRGATAGLVAIEAAAAGLTWYGSSTCGCAAVERIGLLECRVDVSGPGRSAVHPVAELVVEAVALSPMADLLQPFARAGARPGGWVRPVRWAEPVHGWEVLGRQAVKIYDYAGPGRSGLTTPVMIRSLADVEAEVAGNRARYADWLDAMDELAWVLSGRNLGFAVLPCGAPIAPWYAA